jgi:hypothetical protein
MTLRHIKQRDGADTESAPASAFRQPPRLNPRLAPCGKLTVNQSRAFLVCPLCALAVERLVVSLTDRGAGSRLLESARSSISYSWLAICYRKLPTGSNQDLDPEDQEAQEALEDLEDLV